MTKKKAALTPEQINGRALALSKKIAGELSAFIRATGKVIADIKVTSTPERNASGVIMLRQSVNVQYGDVSFSEAPPPPTDRVPAQVERVG